MQKNVQGGGAQKKFHRAPAVTRRAWLLDRSIVGDIKIYGESSKQRLDSDLIIVILSRKIQFKVAVGLRIS